MKKYFYFITVFCLCTTVKFSAQTTFTISTFAGSGVASSTGNGGVCTAATFNAPHGVVVDPAGNIYVSELAGHRIRKISTTNIVTLFAGTGVAASGGDGGLATSAQLNQPAAMTMDAAGNLYVAEFSGNRIRKITPGGIISTVAGNGTGTFAGDGGLATAASINKPIDVKIDVLGNLYIADASNNRVRMVNTSSIITTVIGTGLPSSTGDGGLANLASVNYPASLYFDALNNLYVCELSGNCVRKVNSVGIISTIVGNGTPSSTGDGGLATAATINGAGSVVIDVAGNILVSEYQGARIRSINSGGIISTLAGTGVGGFSGDGGLSTAAQINGPFQMSSGLSGNIYVAEYSNNRVRHLTSACTTTVSSTVSSTSLSCNGAANGSATMTPTGGASYNYTWIPSGGNAGIASGLTAGLYTVVVKNSCGYYSANTVNITQPTPIITTVFGNPMTVCAFGSSTLTTLASGGTPGYTYSWSPSGGAGSSVGVTTSVTTIYTATATDANSCTKTSTITILVNTPSVTAASSASLLCVGQTATFTASGANTYTWSTASTNTVIAVSPSVTTTYTLSGTNGAGCVGATVFTQSVSVCSGIAQLNNTNQISIYPNPNNGEFVILNNNLNADSHFEVYNGIGQLVIQDVMSQPETKVTINNVPAGIYFVKLLNGTQLIKVQKFVKN